MLACCLIAAGYSVELAESAKHTRRVLANERIELAIVATDQRDGNDLRDAPTVISRGRCAKTMCWLRSTPRSG
jgi:hypothetical protein